jgi:hypothetical protein
MQLSFCSLVTAALLSAVAVVGSASNMDFLKDAPVGQFKEEDMRMLRAAAAQLEQENVKGAAREWRNEATGNSGRLEILAVFTSEDGRHCMKLLVITRSKSAQQRSEYPVCAGTDGRWLIDTEAAPKRP